MKTFNLAEEKPISLRDAAEWLPRRENGKPIDWRTIERWMNYGHKGVFLEGCLIGRLVYTSKESLQRFSVELAKLKQSRTAPRPSRRKAKPSKGHEKAKQSLERAGFKVGRKAAT